MSNAFVLTPSATPLSQLFAAIDRWLLAYAEMTIRNGDIPRYDVLCIQLTARSRSEQTFYSRWLPRLGSHFFVRSAASLPIARMSCIKLRPS